MGTSRTVIIVTLLLAALFAALPATPLFAQEPQQSSNVEQATRGYITGVGGLAFFPNITNFSTPGEQGTPSVAIELGARIVPHLMLFGEGGWVVNLQSGLQPTLVNTTSALFTSHNYVVTGTGSLPVWYGLGGLRIAGPNWDGFTPYVLGGAGLARLSPSPKFTYVSGTLPGVATPAVNADVTATLTSAGDFKAPLTSSALMWTLGGGVQLAVGGHWVADARYRYMRIPPDSALSAGELSTNMISLGFGLRF